MMVNLTTIERDFFILSSLDFKHSSKWKKLQKYKTFYFSFPLEGTSQLEPI